MTEMDACPARNDRAIDARTPFGLSIVTPSIRNHPPAIAAAAAAE